jgi:quercetin dioxygenase-like cupin family protein
VTVVRGATVNAVITPRRDQKGLRLRRLATEGAGSGDYVLAETEVPPGCRHEIHRHPDADQAIYILRGHLTLLGPSGGGPEVTLGPGDVVHVPAGEWHGTANESTEMAATLTVFGGVGSAADAGYEEFEIGDSNG